MNKLKEKLEEACEQNPFLSNDNWISDPLGYCKEDYSYSFRVTDSKDELKEFFSHGNWAIRQGVIYKNTLAFVQQVNGGDEWYTLVFDENQKEWLAFESISWSVVVDKGSRYFEQYLERLESASIEDLVHLNY